MNAAMRWLCLVGLAGCGLAAAQTQLSASSDEPRAFGYQIGDLVTRHIRVSVPAGLQLDERSVPQAGRRGRAFELRQVHWQQHHEAGHTTHELRLQYQVFISPPQVQTLELPPLVLQFDGQPRPQALRIDAWPVTVAPLVPAEVSPRRGLGELRPDLPPPVWDTTARRARLAAWALLLLLPLGYLAHVYFGAPWWARRQRPFEQAWRLLDGHTAVPQEAAFRALHEALNRSAGRVLFESLLDSFVTEHPRYAVLRSELAEFFQRSQHAFFGARFEPAKGADTVPWLRQLCRRCRDIERGTA
jgi:mxaA protein